MGQCVAMTPERVRCIGRKASTTSFVRSDAEPRWVTLTKRRSVGVMVAALVIAVAVIAVAVLLVLRMLATGS
jgi:hypothetical protein